MPIPLFIKGQPFVGRSIRRGWLILQGMDFLDRDEKQIGPTEITTLGVDIAGDGTPSVVGGPGSRAGLTSEMEFLASGWNHQGRYFVN